MRLCHTHQQVRQILFASVHKAKSREDAAMCLAPQNAYKLCIGCAQARHVYMWPLKPRSVAKLRAVKTRCVQRTGHLKVIQQLHRSRALYNPATGQE